MVDVPVYYFVGDRLSALGSARGDLYSIVANDKELLGTSGGFPNALIWDPDIAGGGAVKSFIPYNITTKPNPIDPQEASRATFGFELGLLEQAAKREGVLGAWMVKHLARGIIGTTLDSGFGTRRWRKADNDLYQEFLAHCADAHAFIAQNPVYVRKVRAIIVQMGFIDAFASADNIGVFDARFRQWITDLRTDLAPAGVAPSSIPVIACEVNWRRYSALGDEPNEVRFTHMAQMNDLMRALQFEDPKFKWVDWGGARASVDQLFAAPHEALPIGRRLWNGYLQATESVAAVPGTGIPVYFLIGQSHVAGSTSVDFLIDNAGPDLLHQRPQDLSFIWNHDTELWEKYIPGVNSNTGPYVVGGTQNFGPEVSLLLKLLKRHPQGVFLFKVPANGASIHAGFARSANNIYPWMAAKWAKAKKLLVNALGLVPDVRGCFWVQGEGDNAEPHATNYATNLRTFIANFRQDFSTRTPSSPLMPFVVSQTIDTGYFGPGITKVRQGQQSVAATDSQVSLIEVDDVPVRTDNVHHTGRGTLILGERLDGGLDGVDNMCAIPISGSPTPESSSPSSGGESVGLTSAPMVSSPTTTATAEQIVDAMDAAALNGGVAQYTVNGQTVTLTDPAKILQVRQYYSALLARRNPGGTRTRASL